jgi:excinuclease ABC subunit C
VLEDLGLDYVPIASLAKRAEEVYTPERLQPLVLDLGSPALMALQKIRDEAHRFAITYHKKVRARRTISSELDRIPGWGRACAPRSSARWARRAGCGRPPWPSWPPCQR